MGHNWIIGVLDDLCTYAEVNDLPTLARSLEAASRAAAREVEGADKAAMPRGLGNGAGHGALAGTTGRRALAR